MRIFLLIVLAVLALCQAEETVQPKLGFPHLPKIDFSKYGISEETLKLLIEQAKLKAHPEPKIVPLGPVNPEIPENLKHKIVDNTVRF